MPNEPEPVKPTSPVVRESTIELKMPARVLCAVLGVASEVFAAIVLWRGEGGAATVAFIVLGAVLIILAASGVIPGRIKSGGHEVEMLRRQVIEGAQESTDNALATMTRDEIEGFIEDTLRSRERSTSDQAYVAASRAQEALDFEQRTLLNLRTLDPTLDFITQIGRGAKYYDAQALLRDGKILRIDFKWKLTASSLTRTLDAASRNGEVNHWIIFHAANQNEIAIVTGMIEQLATKLEGTARVVVSRDHPEDLARVLRWMQGEGSRPLSGSAFISF